MEDMNRNGFWLGGQRQPEHRDEQYEEDEQAYPSQSPDREQQTDASEEDSEENAGLGFGG
jgi:hypothetical protein